MSQVRKCSFSTGSPTSRAVAGWPGRRAADHPDVGAAPPVAAEHRQPAASGRPRPERTWHDALAQMEDGLVGIDTGRNAPRIAAHVMPAEPPKQYDQFATLDGTATTGTQLKQQVSVHRDLLDDHLDGHFPCTADSGTADIRHAAIMIIVRRESAGRRRQLRPPSPPPACHSRIPGSLFARLRACCIMGWQQADAHYGGGGRRGNRTPE